MKNLYFYMYSLEIILPRAYVRVEDMSMGIRTMVATVRVISNTRIIYFLPERTTRLHALQGAKLGSSLAFQCMALS